jgi:hypothetical protein
MKSGTNFKSRASEGGRESMRNLDFRESKNEKNNLYVRVIRIKGPKWKKI